jgi:hypothetical protein
LPKEASAQTEAQADAAATFVAPQLAEGALAEKPADKEPTRAQKAPKANGAREGSKTAIVLGLLKRAGGVTSKELMDTTGWQAHSVRGFLSGTVGKKMGLKVVSVKGESGERSYSIGV